MNKFLAMAVSAACALGVSAGPLTIQELSGSPEREFEVRHDRFKQALGPVMQKAPELAASENAPESIVGKTYVSFYNDGEWDCNGYFTVAEGEDGGLVFVGMANGYDVKGTYDAATGTITIPTDVVIGTHSTYGDITMYGLNLAAGKYTTEDIVGIVDGNTITFNYGIYGTVTAGTLIFMGDMTATESNATASFTQNANSFSTPLLMNKTGENSVEMIGLSNLLYGGKCPVPLTLDAASNTATIPFGTLVDKQYTSAGTVSWLIGGFENVTGLLDDLKLNIVTSETTSLLSVDKFFYGYPNEGSYRGYTFTNLNINVDFNVFTGEVSGGGDEETDTPNIGGIDYLLNRENSTATVTGCLPTLTNVEIPATFTYGEVEYTVVGIDKEAFMANKTIASLSIPATVKTIGQDACRNMGGLKDLYINDLAAWCAIEFYNGNANPIYNVFPTRESAWGNVHFNDVINPAALEIPEGVTEIGRAFYGYKVLESVTLPSTLTKLGDQTFANCAKLTEVVVPEGVTSIGSAFWSCTALKSVTLPSTLENITGSIFYGCKALESIELPAALQTVGRMAFSGCEALTSITSYAAVPPTAGMMAFYDVPVDIPVNVPESSIDAYKAADEWKDFTNYIGFKVSVNPFEPKGDEEVIGQLQILSHPTKDKVNILKDAAQLGEGADGWSVQCMNESKNLEQAGSITIDGVAYPTIKLSNGAQNTVTLPEGYVANAVTIYSVINKDGATARPCYFKEIDGVEYTSDKDYLVSYKDFANPDVSYFTLKGKNTFTFTNTGEQALVVLVVDYSEAPKSPFGDAALDAPASVWPSNGSAMLPLDGSIKLSYGVDVEVFGNATLNDKEIALAVENNVVSIDYTGLTPSTEYTLTIPAKGIGNTEASNTEDIVYTFTTAPENVLFYADFNNYPFGYSEKYRDIDDNVNIIAKNSTDVTAEVAGMTFYSGSKGRVVALKAPLNPEDPEADYGPYLPEYAGASARTVQLIGGGNGLYVETPEVEGPCELTFYIANASTTAGTLILTDERGDKEKALTEFAIEGAKKMFKYTYSYPYKGAVKFRLYNQKVQINVNDILIIKGEGPGIERPGEEPDTEAPVTTAVWPGTEAYAPVEGNVVVTFDEPIVVTGKASLNGADLDINVEGNTLTVAYAGLENGKHYTMEIPAVSDEAGNAAEPFTVDINTVADDVIYYTDFAQYPYSYFTAYNHIPNEGADNEDIIAKNSTDVTATVAGITYYSGTNGRVVAMGKPNLFEDAGEEHVGASARCIQISGGENGLYAELPATEGPCDLTIFVGNGPATAGSILLTDAQGDTENPLATFTLPAEKKMYRFDYKHTAEGPVTLRLYNMGTQFNLHDILLVKGEVSGLNVIDADDAEAVYYNLQGVRVENPAAGLYIRVRGQKVDKVIVK